MYRQVFEERKRKYFESKGELDSLEKKLSEVEGKLDYNKEQLSLDEVTRAILQKTSDKAREKARALLESTMTAALQHVFGPTFEANIEMRTLNGKPSAEIYVSTDYGNGNIVKATPEDSCGGGIVDIISIALRIAMIQLHTEPCINGPIILDEPGKHVSADYSLKLAEFLKYVSSQFNKQIIFVTHNQDLKSVADKCYNAKIIDGVTQMTVEQTNISITDNVSN